MRKVIVLGGSAGGIQALCSVIAGLPADLPAALLAVIHIAEGDSRLAEILQRCSRLQVLSPKAPEPLVAGRLYVALPNRHLVVKNGCVLAFPGPRENRHRPAVDTLFRSAARAYRSKVIGVVLSGALDDGTGGALAIKARGGKIIVQDPAEAQTPDMPKNVLRHLQADYCLPLAKIPTLLIQLAGKGRPIPQHKLTKEKCDALNAEEETLPLIEPQGYTCPECGGALMKLQERDIVQYRCHVGHIYSLESFSEAHSHALERALWVALRRLNEQHAIQESLAQRSTNDSGLKHRYKENALAAARDMRLLHEILLRL